MRSIALQMLQIRAEENLKMKKIKIVKLHTHFSNLGLNHSYRMRPTRVLSVELPEVVRDLLVDLVRHRLLALEVRQVGLGRDLEHVRVHGDGARLVQGH